MSDTIAFACLFLFLGLAGVGGDGACSADTGYYPDTTFWNVALLVLVVAGLVEIFVPIGTARAKLAWVGAAVFVMSLVAWLVIQANAYVHACD